MKLLPAAPVLPLCEVFLKSTTRLRNVVPNAGFHQIKDDSLSEDLLLTSSELGRKRQQTVALARSYIKASLLLCTASLSGKPDIPPGVTITGMRSPHLQPSLLEPLFL